MNPIHFAVLMVIAASTLTGCGATYDQKALEKNVAEDWRHCERVRPDKVTIEESNKQVVRYSYELKVLVDGTATGYTCFKPNEAMLEALANKSVHQLKAGESIPVTQEIALR